MKPVSEIVKGRPWVAWLLFFATMGVVFVVGLFAASVVQRRTEALTTYRPATDIGPFEPRSDKWGAFFPREHETWKKTRETGFASKHNGNAPADALEEDPRLVVLWAGYAFSKDYSKPRGHAWAIDDLRATLRTGSPMKPDEGPQPGTCWTCKGPDAVRLIAKEGPEKLYAGKWAARGREMRNPVGCADCHDPKTMDLRVARPALREAFARRGKDLAAAPHQEMRSLVCAQCHVEYFFKGEGKYLAFPWDKGTGVAEVEAYYDEAAHVDWVHPVSGAEMLKAQHPDYEVFTLGIHARRGLACADCHMPYTADGGVKFTSHQVASPLKNVNATCQVCHRESEEELRADVEERQDTCLAIRIEAEDLIVRAHYEAKKARELGATKEELAPALTLIRHAQWRWDFAAAGHGSSFHAPLAVAAILSSAVAKAQAARLQLARVLAARGFTGEVELPDISTKAKAQAAIGLDMAALAGEKKKFLDIVVPKWDAGQGW